MWPHSLSGHLNFFVPKQAEQKWDVAADLKWVWDNNYHANQ